MTVPMIGWMGYRGHSWRANAEMSASMFLPTFAVIGMLGAGVVTDMGMLMVIEHVAMLAGMLAMMLLRPAEYSHDHGTHACGSRPSRCRRERADDASTAAGPPAPCGRLRAMQHRVRR